MRSVERELAWRARQQPSRIGINAVEQALPEAARKIVFDKLHIVRRLDDAMNAMHLAQHRALLA